MAKVDPIDRRFAEPQMVNLLKVSCRRQLINARRHERVLKEVPLANLEDLGNVEALGPEDLAERSHEIDIGQEAVRCLSRRDRLIFRLRYQMDLSPKEIQHNVPGLTARAYHRAIHRAKARVLAAHERIDSGQRCLEMERGILRKYISGAGSPEEAQMVQAHLKHCRACQRSGVEMREYLQDIGSTLAGISTLGGFGSAKGGQNHLAHLLDVVSGFADAIGRSVGSVFDRARILGLRISGAVPGSGGEGGFSQALGVSGVKVASVCAGVAAAASCAAAGIVPGVAALDLSGHQQGPKPTKAAVRESPLPEVLRDVGDGSADPTASARLRPTTKRDPAGGQRRVRATRVKQPARSRPNSKVVTSGQQVGTEFGADAAGAGTPIPTLAPAPPAPPAPDGGGGSSGGGGGGGSESEFGL